MPEAENEPVRSPDPLGGDPSDDDPVRAYLRREVERLEQAVQERDANAAAMNRYLGALEERIAAFEEGRAVASKVEAGALTRGWKWIARHFQRSKEATPLVPDDPTDRWGVQWRPPLVPMDPANENKRVVAVTAFDMDRKKIRTVLDTVERICSSQDSVPVFLTDCDLFEEFRGRRVAFEYLPKPQDREAFGDGLPWDLYVRRRIALFKRKWNPAGFISFGQPDELVKTALKT